MAGGVLETIGGVLELEWVSELVAVFTRSVVVAPPPFSDRLRVRRVGTGGASRLPAEIGSEDSPMCWLVSWLVAHVMPAVNAMPSSAATAQR